MGEVVSLAGPCGILYAEDFDTPPPVRLPVQAAPPPPPPPTFTAAELEDARVSAADAARAEVMEAAEMAALQMRAAALSGIAEGVGRLREEVAAEVGRATEELSRAVLSMLQAALPSLMDATAGREISGLLGRLLPGLHAERQVTVRVSPEVLGTVEGDLAGLDEEQRARIRLVGADALAPGDLRVSWHEGRLVRDTAAIARASQEILRSAGYAEVAHV